jgi:thioredoxin reductase
VYDLLPPLLGIEALYGRSVFQCPYCDGWEMRGKRIAVYGRRQRGLQMARAMTSWDTDIVLCTDGRAGYSAGDRQALQRNGITVNEKPVAELRGSRGRLTAVVFEDGDTLARDALFFDTPSRPQSKLAESLGCQFNHKGGVLAGEYEATSVPGVFVAGNITRDVQLSIVAAAEGARAAFGINLTLTREDFAKRSA